MNKMLCLMFCSCVCVTCYSKWTLNKYLDIVRCNVEFARKVVFEFVVQFLQNTVNEGPVGN